MTSTTFTCGNVITTVVDLTNGVGGRTAEEILALTGAGAVKEYSETLPDGRTITYSLEVEEEVLEEEQDIEIASSRTVTTCTAHGTGGEVETVQSVLEGEEITVVKDKNKKTEKKKKLATEVKKLRRCGLCSDVGHNRARCPMKEKWTG
eukprot:GFUD01034491.1.p1 GENE.GFUD01034491.1~~GFUD01034491.1.p1  ORF type:complete len:149 (+),score=70.02 GFUD01034491.1:51-497(+)